MSRESKLFSEDRSLVNKRIKEYESFGWELLSINGNDVSMARETQNKVYSELVKNEYNYEDLMGKQRALVKPTKPADLSFGTAFILILLAIIPGVLYIVYKNSEGKKYRENLSIYETEYNQLEQEIKTLCEKSRATFFARQE